MLKTIFACCCMLCLLVCCKKPEKIYYTPAPFDPSVPADTGSITLPDTSIIRSYLALGDSYTIGQSVSFNERFPVQVVKKLGSLHIKFNDPEIIAQTGWTTGNLLRRLENAAPIKDTYDIVTLLIGVNNQYQHRTQSEYMEEFVLLLKKAIQYAGDNKNRVFVLSIPDYGVTPFAGGGSNPAIAAEIDAFNGINKQISSQYNVNYLDITGYSRLAATNPSLIAGDGLHPSGIEYAVWTEHLVPMILAALL